MNDIRFVGHVLIGIPRSQMNMAHDDTIMISVNTANSGHRVSDRAERANRHGDDHAEHETVVVDHRAEDDRAERHGQDRPPRPSRDWRAGRKGRLERGAARRCRSGTRRGCAAGRRCRALGRSHVVVGADPQRGEPDGDEQQPSREILTTPDAHAETPSPECSLVAKSTLDHRRGVGTTTIVDNRDENARFGRGGPAMVGRAIAIVRGSPTPLASDALGFGGAM